MIPALISGVVSMLLQNNLPKVAQAVVDKGVDYVSDKLGAAAQQPPAQQATRINNITNVIQNQQG